jgi:hypothetical protein
VHVQIRSGCQRRQPDFGKRCQAAGLAAGETEERPVQRRSIRVFLPLWGAKSLPGL